jgi:hypothetical protein
LWKDCVEDVVGLFVWRDAEVRKSRDAEVRMYEAEVRKREAEVRKYEPEVRKYEPEVRKYEPEARVVEFGIGALGVLGVYAIAAGISLLSRYW